MCSWVPDRFETFSPPAEQTVNAYPPQVQGWSMIHCRKGSKIVIYVNTHFSAVLFTVHKVSYSCLLVLTKKDDLEKIAAAAANMAVTCCLASWFLFWLDSRGKKIRQLQGCYRQLDNTERERWWMGQLLCQLSVPGQACVCSQVESSRGVRQLDNTKREVSVPWQACVCSQVENSTGINKSNQRVQ